MSAYYTKANLAFFMPENVRFGIPHELLIWTAERKRLKGQRELQLGLWDPSLSGML